MPQATKTRATSAWTATVITNAAAASTHSTASFIPSLVRR